MRIVTTHRIETSQDGTSGTLWVDLWIGKDKVGSRSILHGPLQDVQDFVCAKLSWDELQKLWRMMK